MTGRSPDIRPEFSALGIRKPISPLLPVLIRAVMEVRKTQRSGSPRFAVDYGCGQLRNLKELRKHFPLICLVDTESQLARKHDFGGERLTVREYIAQHYHKDQIMILTDTEFQTSDIRPAVIFTINVMDVVPRDTRNAMLRTVREHLPPTGQFASLVARNDSRTLQLCRNARKHDDGYLFPNHGAFTYYKNWADDTLQRLYRSHGLVIVRNLSRYRYSCIVCVPKTA